MDWKHTQEVLNGYADDFLQRLRDRLIRDDKYASGKLLASLKTTVVCTDSEVSVWLSSEDYLQYINEGTKPHWPPKEPIIQWIRDKGIEPYPDNNGRLPTVEGLAFLISRKISRDGTEADPVVDETLREVNADWLPRIESAVMEDVEDEVNAIIINSDIW